MIFNKLFQNGIKKQLLSQWYQGVGIVEEPFQSIPNHSKFREVIKIKESDVQNSIRLALNPYAIIFRANVGTVRTADGRYFNTGLPKGFSDLFGFRKTDGKLIFIEVKNEKGRLQEDQKHFLSTMQQYPVISGVARSPEEAIKIVMEENQ